MKIMDKEYAMELIGRNWSDTEIKMEFYESLVEEYFPESGVPKGEEKKAFFFKLDEQLVNAGFTRVETVQEENHCEHKYRIAGTEAYIRLSWSYLERYRIIWTDCHVLFLVICLDQFVGDGDVSNEIHNGLYVNEFGDYTGAKVAYFIRNLPQWEAEWKAFDIEGIHKEREKKLNASKMKCDAFESPVRALIRNIGLPYDFEKHDIGYTIFFQIAGKWYVRINFSADECDDDKLQELEKFIKATDALCRRFENWDIRCGQKKRMRKTTSLMTAITGMNLKNNYDEPCFGIPADYLCFKDKRHKNTSC